MSATVDSLGIEIEAQAQSAYSAIDKLTTNLTKLASALDGMNVAKLAELGNSLSNLGTGMSSLWQTTKTADFSRLARNLTVISNVDVSSLNSASNALQSLSDTFSNLSVSTEGAEAITSLASSVRTLGSKNIEKAITNIPRLATAMSQLMNTLSTAPRVDSQTVNLANAMANLASNGRTMGTASNSLVCGINSIGNSSVTASRKVKSLAYAFGTLYANCFLLIRGFKKLGEAIKGTADYLEAYNYFSVTVGKIAKDQASLWANSGEESAQAYVDNFADTLESNIYSVLDKMSGLQIDKLSGIITASAGKLGMNITQITQYAASIASVTNAIGASAETSELASKALTMLAADLGSLKNLDFDTVSANLQSGLMGMARAMYRYGVDITEANLKNYAFANGITKSVDEMTQAEKVQLRLLAILDQTEVAYGDLANTINSPANMLRQLKNNANELGIVLGQLFIPVLQNVIPAINGTVVALKRLAVNLAEFMGIKLNLDDFGEYSTELGDFSDTADEATTSVNKLTKGIRGFDELNVISSASNTTSELKDNIELQASLDKAMTEYEKKWNEAYASMTNAADTFADSVSQKIEPLKKIIQDFISGDYASAGEDVSKLVLAIEGSLAQAIEKVDFEGLGKKIGDFIKGIDWEEAFKGLGDIVKPILEGAISAWETAFDVAPIETAIITACAGMKFLGLGTVVGSALNKTVASSEFTSQLSAAWTTRKITILGEGIGVTTGVMLTLAGIKAMVQGADSASKSIEGAIGTVVGTALASVSGAGLAVTASKLLGTATGGAIASVGFGTALSITLPLTLGLAVTYGMHELVESAEESDKEKDKKYEQFLSPVIALVEDLGNKADETALKYSTLIHLLNNSDIETAEKLARVQAEKANTLALLTEASNAAPKTVSEYNKLYNQIKLEIEEVYKNNAWKFDPEEGETVEWFYEQAEKAYKAGEKYRRQFANTYGSDGEMIMRDFGQLDMLTESRGKAIATVKELQETLKSQEAEISRLQQKLNKTSSESGKGITTEIGNAVTENEAEATKPVETMAENISKTLEGLVSDCSKKGKEAVDSFASAITSNLGVARSAFAKISNISSPVVTNAPNYNNLLTQSRTTTSSTPNYATNGAITSLSQSSNGEITIKIQAEADPTGIFRTIQAKTSSENLRGVRLVTQ